MADANEAKKKALQLTLDKLDKTYGKGAVMKMGDEAIEEVEAISSGSIGLDLALGVGGYPRGRVIEIYGPESSGKTTLTLHAIAECQKAGGIAAFIDAEHAFDRFYAKKLGVDISELIISQPDHGDLWRRHGPRHATRMSRHDGLRRQRKSRSLAGDHSRHGPRGRTLALHGCPCWRLGQQPR